jgi:type I restriction enzyme M protein
MGKTNPLNEADLTEFITLQKNFSDSALSWTVDVSSINSANWDLSVRNPNGNDVIIHRSPAEIIAEIEVLDEKNQEILRRIKELL